MRSNLSILVLCMGLFACVTRSTEALPEPSTGNSLDASSDGSADATGGNGGADTGPGSSGGEGGMSTGADSGESCDKSCSTPGKSWCDPELGDCAACKTAMQCGAFAGTTPVCKAGVGCVQCTDDANGDALCKADGKVCKAGANVCVQCNVTGDCDAASTQPVCASDTCRGCAADSECTGGTTCDESTGKCVQCDENDRDACGANVCNVLTKKCTSEPVNSAQVCEPCVSDEQCQVGQLCIRMFGDSDGNGSKDAEVGWFCQWQKNGGGAAPAFCDSSVRPYFGEQTAVSSLNQPSGSFTICTLAASTCPAITEKFRDACGRFGSGAAAIIVENRNDSDIPGRPVAKELITPDDSVCGIGGKCVAKSLADGAYQCSVPCASSNNDCPVGAFTCGGAPPGTANVCGI